MKLTVYTVFHVSVTELVELIHTKDCVILLKGCELLQIGNCLPSYSNLLKKRQLLKERICSKRQQILSFRKSS